MKVDHLNYSQLKVLLAVYKYRQSHLAANELGITDSAVSRSLRSLRTLFKDSLFLRRASGMVPTEKTEQLVPIARALVEQYHKIENHHSDFTPLESGGQFTIMAYDEFVYAVQTVVEQYILPEAPNMKFDIRTLSHDCSKEIANGDVDFMVVYEGFDGRFMRWEMFAPTGELYILANSEHDILKENITLGTLSKYPLLEIDNYSDVACPLLVNFCRDEGLEMQVAAYTDSVAAAIRMLRSSDKITLSCNQFTRELVELFPGVDYVKLPEHLTMRVKKRRALARETGNYLAYGDVNESPAFFWVKSMLVSGLAKEWSLATARGVLKDKMN